MRFAVVIEKGDGSFGAYVPDLPGCVAVAETEEEVRQLIAEAPEFHLEDMRESGEVVPEPHSSVVVQTPGRMSSFRSEESAAQLTLSASALSSMLLYTAASEVAPYLSTRGK